MRQLNVLSLSAVVLAGVAIVSAAFAKSAQFQQSGTRCNPAQPADEGRLRFDNFGAANGSTTVTAGVECGATLPVGTVSSVSLTVYDRHPDANVDVCCVIRLTGREGFDRATATRCSTGFGSAAKRLSDFVPPAVFVGNMTLTCSIPVRHPNGFSHVTSYAVRTTF